MSEIAEKTKAVAEQMAKTVRAFLEKQLHEFGERIGQMEAKLAATPQPEKGERGERGERGEKGEPGETIKGERGEKGEPGEPGESIKGERGEKGDAPAIEALVEQASANLLPLLDSISSEIAEIKNRAPEKGERGEKGEPGESIKSERGEKGEPGETIKGDAGREGKDGKDGRDGRDAVDGMHGRDALDIEILPEVDAAKKYPVGTFASMDGGLFRACRHTTPLASGESRERCGWSVVVDGIASFDATADADGRTFKFCATTSSGKLLEKNFRIPSLIYREVFKQDSEYATGDVVTWGGSLFIAMADTKDKPETSTAWRLAVKRGRDGKNGKDSKGESQEDAVVRL